MKVDDKIITKLINEGERISGKGRFRRLKFLLSLKSLNEFPTPALAWEYYQEARLCWYTGAFVSTIIMTQLTFEELLRNTYRAARGVKGKLSNDRKVNEAGFSDLISEALRDKVITKSEAKNLNRLRRTRNPYVHTKDIQFSKRNKWKNGRNDWLYQHLKITAPRLIGQSVEREAKSGIRLLCHLYPKISYRIWGP